MKVTTPRPGRFAFRDGGLELAVEPDGAGIDLRIANGERHTVRVLWDAAAFVAVDGTNARALHAVESEGQGPEQVPSVIAPGAALVDRVVPGAAWRSTSDVAASGPLYLPLLLRPCAESEEAFVADAHAHEGRYVKLLLPLDLERGRQDYLLVFQLGRARLRHAKGCVDPRARPPEGPRRPQPWEG